MAIFLRITLPTLLLCNSFSSDLKQYFHYEKFSNGYYSIDFYLDVNPNSFFKKNDKYGYIYFSALISGNKENKVVYGYRVNLKNRIYYCFNFEDGSFVGELVKKDKKTYLHYLIEKNNKEIEQGKLFYISG